MSKLIIANDIDSELWLRAGGEGRAWAARALWYASRGDTVILPELPAPEYVGHVLRSLGLANSGIRFLEAPAGRQGSSMIDPAALFYDDWLRHAIDKSSTSIDDVLLLFPSAALNARWMESDIEPHPPAMNFFSQAGGHLANSKATFRAFAAGLSMSIPRGTVARDASEGAACVIRLAEAGVGRFVLKRAHAGAGAGNIALELSTESDYGHAGIRRSETAEDASLQSVMRLLEEEWDWLSRSNKDPVIIEEYIEDHASLCIEYSLTDVGVRAVGTSTLIYDNGSICAEVFDSLPSWLPEFTKRDFFAESLDLASRYYHAGYRGSLSIDALASSNGIFFTEANARTATGGHVHASMKTISSGAPTVQYSVPTSVAHISAAGLFALLDSHKLEFNPDAGTGIRITMPPSPLSTIGGFSFLSSDVTTDRLSRFCGDIGWELPEVAI